ncbi:lipopolysaccharide biosynthesis protein [Oryzomonas sagensis]|uniref:Lipopolysaccharide biosynthesis protein n=1 Tax=Oryzomonas sagensis TaxID=2603857 RepID=A0ABQ6TPT5_9BACT|nr:Wzz/FepE/Etk N-terminal domain-containing protein [Oryzomonas sagensis]KAB0671051.1 lipopolysaccharide biosynthesis protein [Oryzomonas sagensis]
MNATQEQCPLPEEEEINLLELLQVVARRKSVIIKICTAAVIIAVCYSLALKNIYTASAKILPPQKESGGGLSALLSQAGGLASLAGGMGGLGGSTDLYLGILKSRSVADSVIKRLNLQKEFEAKSIDETRKKLEGAVKFKAGKDGIISIDAESRDPQKAAQLANTFVAELGRRSVELNLSKAGAERVFLEKRLEVVKQDLRNAENDMKAFQEKYKTFKADSQATAAIEGIARLKAEIITKEGQLATLRNSMTDESSEVKALQAGISRLKSQLGSMSGSGGTDVIPAVGNIPALGVEYVRKMRELKTQEAIFEQLTKQYEVAKISEAKDSSSVQVLDEAVAPLKKSKPKRSMIVILAAVTAFFASIFVVFIQEYLSKLSPEDAVIIRDIRNSLRFRRHDR